MTLHPVHGHESLRGALAGAVDRGGLPGSVLLHGPSGVGKQRLALWVAQLILCESPTTQGPCQVCRSCRLAMRIEHPDLHWYFPLSRPKGVSGDRLGSALEDARHDALADVRSQPLRAVDSQEPRGLYLATIRGLRRRAVQRPSMGSRQVFIVGQAEELVPQESSPEAANALLKLLEEPPAATWFILTASEPGRLLPTIRSRTLPLFVPALAHPQVKDFLVDTLGVEPETGARAARLSQGSIGRAIGFLDDGGEAGSLERTRRSAFNLLTAGLAAGRGASFAPALSFPVSRARGLADLFSALEMWIRDLGAAAAGVGEAIVNEDAREQLERIVQERRLHPSQAARAFETLDEARILAAGNVNPQLIIAGLLRGLQRDLATPVRPS